MNFIIALACMVMIGGFNGIRGYSLSWYKDAMTADVVPYYVAAYDALQKKIINPLLNADVDQLNNGSNGSTAVGNLVHELNCGVSIMHSNLVLALNQSGGIAKTVDVEVLAIVASISTTEQEIAQKRTAIASLNTQINQAQQQVSTAEQAVRDKEQGVGAADRDLQEAQRAVDAARTCRGKRFIGGSFFRGIENGFQNIVAKPICAVINMGGIDRAKDRRGDAERQLNSARQQLESYRQQLANLRNQQTNLQNQLTQSNAQLSSLSVTLNQMRGQQILITNISAELRQVISHLATFFSSTTVLQKVIERLIDFELLIAPLNAIYNGMYQGGLLTRAEGSNDAVLITSETITKIRRELDQLTVKLSTMPFNTNGTQAC